MQDVSGLFPDVLKNMQTDDLEQKKLVYLYLMNYAKTQPELVILAVNTFVKDTDDPNPLVRALAIRTMGCLRAEKIIDYLCDPLQKCLRDENPYVRKTAALCVAKLYDLKPELVIENGFLEQLQDMIADSNPMARSMLRQSLINIHLSCLGRRQYGRCFNRYSYCRNGFWGCWECIRHHEHHSEQTSRGIEWMLRMGPCRHPQCSLPVRNGRRQGKRAHLRTCRSAVSARKCFCGARCCQG